MRKMFVTKHCEPVNRDRMLNGAFRIGSTLRYANMEGGGLFDDHLEGHAAKHILGNQQIDRLEMPGLLAENVSLMAETAISYEYNVDSHVFCASDGEYNLTRHQAILNGSGEYQPNKGYTDRKSS